MVFHKIRNIGILVQMLNDNKIGYICLERPAN
jgi:hypothetical protein